MLPGQLTTHIYPRSSCMMSTNPGQLTSKTKQRTVVAVLKDESALAKYWCKSDLIAQCEHNGRNWSNADVYYSMYSNHELRWNSISEYTKCIFHILNIQIGLHAPRFLNHGFYFLLWVHSNPRFVVLNNYIKCIYILRWKWKMSENRLDTSSRFHNMLIITKYRSKRVLQYIMQMAW